MTGKGFLDFFLRKLGAPLPLGRAGLWFLGLCGGLSAPAWPAGVHSGPLWVLKVGEPGVKMG